MYENDPKLVAETSPENATKLERSNFYAQAHIFEAANAGQQV